MTLSSSASSFGKLNVTGMVRDLLDKNVPILPFAGTPVDGTSGTFATYPVGKGALVIDTTTGQLYSNVGEVGNPTWVAFALESGGLGLISAPFVQARFDASVDDLSVGTHPFQVDGEDLVLPAGSLLIGGVVDSTTALTTAGSAQIGVQINAVIIQSTSAVTGAPWDVDSEICDNLDWTSGNMIKIVADQTLDYVIANDPVTGGVFDIGIYYLPGL